MPKKRLIDEHETMDAVEPVYKFRSNNFIMIGVIAIAILSVVFITMCVIKKQRERQKIDRIVASIQNEIFIKQCNLNKMYCCGYKDKKACDAWVESNCSEEDGSLQINCDVKLYE